MATLQDFLLHEDKRKQVTSDCVALIDAEVQSKSGLGGVAVKGGYAVVKKMKPGIIPETVDNLLPEFVDQLETFFAEFQAQDALTIEPYFRARDVEIANALLGVTDARAERTRHKTLKKAYDKLRPTGIKHTAAAVPAIARLIAKHT